MATSLATSSHEPSEEPSASSTPLLLSAGPSEAIPAPAALEPIEEEWAPKEKRAPSPPPDKCLRLKRKRKRVAPATSPSPIPPLGHTSKVPRVQLPTAGVSSQESPRVATISAPTPVRVLALGQVGLSTSAPAGDQPESSTTPSAFPATSSPSAAHTRARPQKNEQDFTAIWHLLSVADPGSDPAGTSAEPDVPPIQFYYVESCSARSSCDKLLDIDPEIERTFRALRIQEKISEDSGSFLSSSDTPMADHSRTMKELAAPDEAFKGVGEVQMVSNEQKEIKNSLMELTTLVKQLALNNAIQPSVVPNMQFPCKQSIVCSICSSQDHLSELCPNLHQDESLAAFSRAQFQQKHDPYSSTYNPGWRDHPNLKYGNSFYQHPSSNQHFSHNSSNFQQPQQGFQQHNQNFQQGFQHHYQPANQYQQSYQPYQQFQNQNQNQNQHYQSQNQNFQQAIPALPAPTRMSLTQGGSNNASNSDPQQARLEELMQQILQQQQNQERQIGQLASSINQIQAQGSSQLPSQTIPNPKGNVSALTLRSGRKISESSRGRAAAENFSEIQPSSFSNEELPEVQNVPVSSSNPIHIDPYGLEHSQGGGNLMPDFSSNSCPAEHFPAATPESSKSGNAGFQNSEQSIPLPFPQRKVQPRKNVEEEKAKEFQELVDLFSKIGDTVVQFSIFDAMKHPREDHSILSLDISEELDIGDFFSVIDSDSEVAEGGIGDFLFSEEEDISALGVDDESCGVYPSERNNLCAGDCLGEALSLGSPREEKLCVGDCLGEALPLGSLSVDQTQDELKPLPPHLKSSCDKLLDIDPEIERTFRALRIQEKISEDSGSSLSSSDTPMADHNDNWGLDLDPDGCVDLSSDRLWMRALEEAVMAVGRHLLGEGEKLRSYEALHQKCGLNTELYRESIRQLTSNRSGGSPTECNYVVWLPQHGLGNRMISITSTFLYALLNDKVLLLFFPDCMNGLFCEPFPNTTWLLPSDFPITHMTSIFDKDPNRYGNLLRDKILRNDMNITNASIPLPAYLYLHLVHNNNDYDRMLYCEDAQLLLRQFPWLLLRSNQYFVPALFLIPMFEQELSLLFPERTTVFHLLGRYLFHPSNAVWGHVTRYYQAYLANAEEILGVQIRTFAEVDLHRHSSYIMNCAISKNLLPSLDAKDAAALSDTI
ncbi:hypothetical protein ZIOFF_025108 [Zingiber officinale]|uniref:Fucosyltransferase n=1 Tax=Zingiber officinale TaxID=94328 RepID=A0A8J5H0A9_ZINOF|nr:hypothetical protein ZIOFF_025108 [Zingiber officinale]